MPGTENRRRKSLLVSLLYEAATVRMLMREMETVHNVSMSAALVRADLVALAEVGLVRFADEFATLTERGKDIARGAAPWPWGE